MSICRPAGNPHIVADEVRKRNFLTIWQMLISNKICAARHRRHGDMAMNRFDTHEVFNQAAPFGDVNLYACDTALREAVAREGAAWADGGLDRLGAQLGNSGVLDLARLANEFPPRLQSYDRSGRRIDEVEFHPAWHELMRLLIAHGAHSLPWEGGQPGGQVARAAAYLLFGQVENGSQCPVTMTFASVPALRQNPRIAARWLPKILTRDYDPRSLPIEQKRGALVGMGMTEKQGGTDVRANTTRAMRRRSRMRT
jgi:putative acyl-CoA dehydrogenase